MQFEESRMKMKLYISSFW